MMMTRFWAYSFEFWPPKILQVNAFQKLISLMKALSRQTFHTPCFVHSAVEYLLRRCYFLNDCGSVSKEWRFFRQMLHKAMTKIHQI